MPVLDTNFNSFKMMKKIVVLVVLGFLATGVFAQEKNKKISMNVDGKCEMCKGRIEKAALNVKGVKFASWDIPTHELSLIIDERKTDAMQVKTALVGAGHDTKELKATEAAYESIHPCCKYRTDAADDSEYH